ncbi:hypothetical protein G6L37_07575 [Agrobacterium rubi]|nr:hypothetical protein [Agrobacterium rubi]NTF25228.1 hypothetical protein [Agrobacterium rubi]
MATYGIRNKETGRIVRKAIVHRTNAMKFFHLSEDIDDPKWEVADFADLVRTFVENRTDGESTSWVPSWGQLLIDGQRYQPIRFRTERDYDVEGGDPVTTREWLETFDLGTVYELRTSVCQTRSIDEVHYGILQGLFGRYDMDRHEHMSLAMIAHSGEGTPNLHGDMGMTRDHGPSRIIGLADLPEDWPISDEQLNHKPFADTRWSLVLLDKTELESWLDFDDIETNASFGNIANRMVLA